MTGLLFYISISIHAPSRERRSRVIKSTTNDRHFNPRSLAGATAEGGKVDTATGISIHAPSRERQSSFKTMRTVKLYFNPRSLAGATDVNIAIILFALFQSTLPRGSDEIDARGGTRYTISIHAPSRERPVSDEILRTSADFNPRSLAGATWL